MTLFKMRKDRDRFEFLIFGKKLVIYRYLRMIRQCFLFLNYMLLRDTLKEKFNVSLPREAYIHLSGKIELVQVPLKDIKARVHGKIVPITETNPYKYLASGKKEEFREGGYGEGNVYVPQSDEGWKRMDRLEEDIRNGKGYDPSISILVLRKNNVLVDGIHRTSALLWVKGGDYPVLCAREKEEVK